MRDILRLSLPLHTCPVCLVPARQFEAQQLSNSFALLHPHLAPSFSHLPTFFRLQFLLPVYIRAPLTRFKHLCNFKSHLLFASRTSFPVQQRNVFQLFSDECASKCANATLLLTNATLTGFKHLGIPLYFAPATHLPTLFHSKIFCRAVFNPSAHWTQFLNIFSFHYMDASFLAPSK